MTRSKFVDSDCLAPLYFQKGRVIVIPQSDAYIILTESLSLSLSLSLNPILCDMKANNNSPKLKTTPRTQLFSCGFFGQCTQTVLSPTTSTPPPLTQAPAPPHQTPPAHAQPESSSSSSSNTSQSFTQWRFPLSNSPISHYSYSHPKPEPEPDARRDISVPPPVLHANLEELFHMAEVHFSSGSDFDRVGVIQLLERSLVPDPRAALEGGTCPVAVVRGVVESLREEVVRKPASKVLLALCLLEENRSVAVEAGAVTAVVDALADAEVSLAERSLAVLELLCTTAEGADEVRAHALAVPMMVEVMGRMEGRGKEHAISVLAVIYGGFGEDAKVAPPEEVARAVMLALQGGCSARGRRKGAQLLRILQENGRSDLTQEVDERSG
ncbi:uncharacterized protein LOC142544524 [Primulina tabacum]|uniref:uncharacterized protein LOC142544524 n=1 Tax=Primulina tabacum TaxID=48773 RepID=UPI003F5ACEB3